MLTYFTTGPVESSRFTKKITWRNLVVGKGSLKNDLSCVYNYPANIYLLKVNNRKMEVFSKLTIKAPEWHQWRCSGVFIVHFEHISHFSLVFLLLNLIKSFNNFLSATAWFQRVFQFFPKYFCSWKISANLHE